MSVLPDWPANIHRSSCTYDLQNNGKPAHLHLFGAWPRAVPARVVASAATCCGGLRATYPGRLSSTALISQASGAAVGCSVTDTALLADNTQVVGAHTTVGCGLGFAQAKGGGDACLHDRCHSIFARHGARLVVLTGVCNVQFRRTGSAEAVISRCVIQAGLR
jgi:hypothetical protein